MLKYEQNSPLVLLFNNKVSATIATYTEYLSKATLIHFGVIIYKHFTGKGSIAFNIKALQIYFLNKG